jgi:hypothetical protein
MKVFFLNLELELGNSAAAGTFRFWWIRTFAWVEGFRIRACVAYMVRKHMSESSLVG